MLLEAREREREREQARRNPGRPIVVAAPPPRPLAPPPYEYIGMGGAYIADPPAIDNDLSWMDDEGTSLFTSFLVSRTDAGNTSATKTSSALATGSLLT